MHAAVLAGVKTQTRVAWSPGQPKIYRPGHFADLVEHWMAFDRKPFYLADGPHQFLGKRNDISLPDGVLNEIWTDGVTSRGRWIPHSLWENPMAMPSLFVRASAKLSAVRTHRIHEIVAADATAEGVDYWWTHGGSDLGSCGDAEADAKAQAGDPVARFRKYWWSRHRTGVHAVRKAWEHNPIVWALTLELESRGAPR